MGRIVYTGVNVALAPLGYISSCTKHNSGCRSRRCVYYSTHTGTCDYLLITGKARSKICGTGKSCTVAKRGRRSEVVHGFNEMPRGKELWEEDYYDGAYYEVVPDLQILKK